MWDCLSVKNNILEVDIIHCSDKTVQNIQVAALICCQCLLSLCEQLDGRAEIKPVYCLVKVLPAAVVCTGPMTVCMGRT